MLTSRHHRGLGKKPTTTSPWSKTERFGQTHMTQRGSHFFSCASQFGAWTSSSVWFTSRHLPSEEGSNNTPTATKDAWDMC
jgi:hypothetical protein